MVQNMGRLFILIAVIGVIVLLVKKIFFSQAKEISQESSQQNQEAKLMKKCRFCELHLPLDEGIQDQQGQFFCSPEHQKQFEQQ